MFNVSYFYFHEYLPHTVVYFFLVYTSANLISIIS